ncbi:MAG: hypothetical protein AABW99_00835 [archaeon]
MARKTIEKKRKKPIDPFREYAYKRWIEEGEDAKELIDFNSEEKK